MRRAAGVTLHDKIRSEEIRHILRARGFIRRMKNYQKKWRHQVERMGEKRSLRKIMEYEPKGGRLRGRPRQRILYISDSSEETDHALPMQTGRCQFHRGRIFQALNDLSYY